MHPPPVLSYEAGIAVIFGMLPAGSDSDIRQNIERYRTLWEITTDFERCGVIEKMLREEAPSSKKYDEDHTKKPPASSKTA